MPNEKLREIIIQWHNTYPTPVNMLGDLVSRIESAFELKERKKTEEPINQTTTLKQNTSTTLKDEVVFTTQPHIQEAIELDRLDELMEWAKSEMRSICEYNLPNEKRLIQRFQAKIQELKQTDGGGK